MAAALPPPARRSRPFTGAASGLFLQRDKMTTTKTEENGALHEALQSRQVMYKLLGSLYQIEVDPEKLALLKGMRFSESEELGDAAARFDAAVSDLAEDQLDDLAADYARTFLSAGIAEGPSAFPLESVYTSRDKLIMQGAYEAVLRILRSHGLMTEHEDLYPDHLGVELEFLSYLSGEALKALEANDGEALEKHLDESKEFLEQHILNWTPRFFDDQAAVACTPFYKELAGVTRAFIEEDRKWFCE